MKIRGLGTALSGLANTLANTLASALAGRALCVLYAPVTTIAMLASIATGDAAAQTSPSVVVLVKNGSSLGSLNVGGNPTTSHACRIDEEQSLWCWGLNDRGQLGSGAPASSAVPRKVDASNWSQVSVGGSHTCAIKPNGRLYCWGRGTEGQLGQPSATDAATPQSVGSATWTAVAAGGSHTCAMRNDSTIWCWGAGEAGQLGTGSLTQRNEPALIDGGGNWIAVSSGQSHACGVALDKSVWCWGQNDHGQVGNGSTANAASPVQVASLSNIAHVSAGRDFTCALSEAGEISCWGRGTSGTLGTTANSAVPVAVAAPAGKTWGAVSAGVDSACAITGDGILHCWGSNSLGQLGSGDTSSRAAPAPVSGAERWRVVDVGTQTACAIRADSSVWCWGANAVGSVGSGDTTDALTPRAIVVVPAQTNTALGFNWDASPWSACSVQCGGGKQTRTVVCRREDGTVADDTYCSGSAPETERACNTAACSSCTTPWGAVVPHGGSVFAYFSDVVPFGSTCNGETRVCTDGNLSGSAAYPTCAEAPPAMCPLPWGGMIAHGQSVIAYSVTVADDCGANSENRTCTNGILSGSYPHPTCTNYGYAWQVGDFSACSHACGGGTQTRAVACVRSDGQAVADSLCGGARPAESQPCNTQSCASCVLPWGGTLGHGQSITSFFQPTAPNCSAGSETRTCINGVLTGSFNHPTCVDHSFTWRTGPFDACSAACGQGSQSRTVVCERNDGVVVGEAFCTTPKPPVTQACSNRDCAACVAPWGQTVPHGQSVMAFEAPYATTCVGQPRVCVDGVLSGSGNFASCIDFGYVWDVGAWSACSLACGDGTQRRDVVCRRNDGQVVGDGFCPGSKPATTQACNTRACNPCPLPWGGTTPHGTTVTAYSQPRADQCGDVSEPRTCTDGFLSGSFPFGTCTNFSYGWQSGGWSGCSAVCGGGQQTRSVFCQRDDGAVVGNGACGGSAPAWTQSCNTQACAFCVLPDGRTLPHGGSVTSYSTPMAGSCAANSETITCFNGTLSGTFQYGACADFTYSWQHDNWSNCSAECAGGTQSRNVWCRRSDGQTVADSFCGWGRPSSSQSCNTQPCAPCPLPWGGWTPHGSQVTAFSSNWAADCAAVSEVRSCWNGNLSGSFPFGSCTNYTHTWATGNWSACSSSCGPGEQTRWTGCWRNDNTIVADSLCGPRPATSQWCWEGSGCTYQWIVGAWSGCSNGCGAGGQTREVTCVRSDGVTMPDDWCGGGKPPTWQGCASHAACGYAWEAHDWSGCSNGCGDGGQTRTVLCRRSDGAHVGDGFCGGGRPADWQGCNRFDACTYAIEQSNWSACSSNCGNGTQSRSVWCQRSDGARVADSFCGAMPHTTQGCAEFGGCTFNWEIGPWGACSGTCAKGGTQNRSVACRRSDGAIVEDWRCGGGKPAVSQGCAVVGCDRNYYIINYWFVDQLDTNVWSFNINYFSCGFNNSHSRGNRALVVTVNPTTGHCSFSNGELVPSICAPEIEFPASQIYVFADGSCIIGPMF